MKTISFYAELVWKTDKSFKVNDGENDVWIPKRIVVEKNQTGLKRSDFEFVIPEWFAKQEGII